VPTLLRVRGFRFFFYSLEEREPPHVHVAHAGRYAKFWLDPVALAEGRAFRDHELTEIRRIVLANAATFREKWHGYLGGKG
jgi:hypothetical protein